LQASLVCDGSHPIAGLSTASGSFANARDGPVQKPNTPRWRADCDKIYAAYDGYGVSDGNEQAFRSGDGGEFAGEL